ncbi:MAG: right-handed parallel beta-helix repeat-containing protein, partial [Rhodanobacteraceae bacterium]
MKVPSSMSLKPLAACLAAALAVVPAGVLLADPTHPLAHPLPPHATSRSYVAQWLATNPGLTKKGQSLEQVLDQAAANARHAAAQRDPPDHPAGIVPVTSCDDDGPGTLRDAMTNAVSGDVIDLTGLTCSTISVTTGALSTVAADLTIRGPGAASLVIDAGAASGVIEHYGTGTLTIEGVTITNGRMEGYEYHGGACVLSSGSVTINDTTISNCYAYTAHAYGGAICASQDITLNRSRLSGNTTKGHFYYYYYPGYPNPYLINGTSHGGGAYAGGRFTITNSTVTHNSALYNNRGSIGGGFASRSGGHVITGSTIDNNYAWLGGGFEILGHSGGETTGLSITNSTISGNSAAISSGGFNSYRLAYTTLHNSTVTDNSAPYCGGMYVYYGVADIKSSIIAANTSVFSYNYFGYYTAADFDVFFSSATVTGDHDAIMTSNIALPPDTIVDDPLLLPLADNGGPTLTHAL